MLSSTGGVLDPRTLGRLERWRKARALFVRPDGPDAERALSSALGKVWSRGQIYGRSRRIAVERTAGELLTKMQEALGPLSEHVRVAPEDPAQTKWDAIGNLAPLPAAARQVGALWLVDALSASALFVEFQPIFDLRTGETVGFEGLLRVRSPEGATRLAVEIFPAAQRLGIALAFERISWIQVLEAARRLPPDAMLFLNVNPRLLSGDGGLAGLGVEAERVQFPYTRLALDLVEVERVESLEQLGSALAVPHDLGVSIALDDITSSYETIRYCSGLSPRWIKVDSEITRGVSTDAPRRSVLRLLAQVARDASVGLIAEGIETAADLDVCLAEGVFAAQGYFLGRPAEEPSSASPEFLGWLAGKGVTPPAPATEEPPAEIGQRPGPERPADPEESFDL
ncbi:MAG: EAL domain-containing protein [Acidobacteria bacterium]|nr:EAL domain-containing protein [Acidobacteriota bacterium]MCA1610487.1 EAL domain-containing protein [Acidobacteriota bacterium]